MAEALAIDPPESFGYQCDWWAVKCQDVHAVAAALGRAGTPCAWHEGLERAQELYGGVMFITPAIGPWMLVVGPSLDENAEEVRSWLESLSTRFSEAQYFGTHRVVEYHAWSRATAGVVTRYYAYLGEAGDVLHDDGQPTPIEIKEGIPDGVTPDEQTVMRIAAAWSVDPTQSEERSDIAPGLGLLVSKYRSASPPTTRSAHPRPRPDDGQ